MILKTETEAANLIKFCNESSLFSLIYENPEIDETVFRLVNQGELYLIIYNKGFFWMFSSSASEISYLNTAEVLDFLSEENRKFILYNLDLF